jgi:hypothetical protein
MLSEQPADDHQSAEVIGADYRRERDEMLKIIEQFTAEVVPAVRD